MKVSWDDYSQYMESHKLPWFQSPPTRYTAIQCFFSREFSASSFSQDPGLNGLRDWGCYCGTKTSPCCLFLQRPHLDGCYWNADSSWNVHRIVCFFCVFLVSPSFISSNPCELVPIILARFGGFRCLVVFLCFCVMVFIWSLQTGGQITIQKIQGHWKDLGSGSLCQVAGRGKECQSQILDDEIPRRCVFPCWVNCISTVWLDLRKTSV